tara:strand:- start:167 stop:940 length:774 start_codon:yes stop_codon:yes gene_type:complete
MFLKEIENKQNFDNNGYVVLDTNLNSNEIFHNIVDKIYKEVDRLVLQKELKNYGGYMMGNFGINQGFLGKKLFSLLFQKDFISLFENLIDNKIDNYCINYGGNLTLPKKGLQHFHTDGDFKKEMYLVSVATENINLMNGPTEICVGSHKKDLSFWKFFFSKKNKLKLTLNKGQVLIRKHNLWHRGTKNNTDKYRLLLSFVFIPIIKKNQVVPISDNLEILPNFFKTNISGRIQEFFYVNLRIFHIFFKLLYSAFSKK